MGENNNIQATISNGRNGEIGERFGFRSYREFLFKKTPQADLTASVYYPHDWKKDDRRPGILFFFGGGFTAGTRHQFVRQCTYLASRGMVAATADYRVHTYHKTTIIECFDDAFSAIRWFRGSATELGIDPDRIAAGGGSAGGTLAAGLGALDGFGGEEDDTGVSPVPNAMVLYNPAFVFEESATGERVRRHANLGVTPERQARISMRDKITADYPPAYVWFGSDDKLFEPAKSVIDHMQSLGCRVELDVAEEADHGYFNDYEPFYSDSVRRIDTFLQSLGYIA